MPSKAFPFVVVSNVLIASMRFEFGLSLTLINPPVDSAINY